VKKLFGMIFIIFPLLLFGCVGFNSIDDAFYNVTTSWDSKVDIIKTIENENYGIAFFTSDNSRISLGYFEKEDKKWEWINTSNCTSIWSMNAESEPYIYCGTILEPKIAKVYVGDKEAEIIELEGSKRVWYYLSKNVNERIKVVLIDGSEEWVKQM